MSLILCQFELATILHILHKSPTLDPELQPHDRDLLSNPYKIENDIWLKESIALKLGQIITFNKRNKATYNASIFTLL